MAFRSVPFPFRRLFSDNKKQEDKRKKPMEILVQTQTGRTIGVPVDLKETIESVKSKIQRVVGIPADQQIRLTFNRTTLRNGKTVEFYGIHDRDIVHLKTKDDDADADDEDEDDDVIQPIYVISLDGRHLKLEVTDEHTVNNVKRMIEERFGTPIDMQKLLFNRKVLHNGDATIQSFGIYGGATLHLVRKFTGHFNVVKLNPGTTN